jgi:hypothetical protein
VPGSHKWNEELRLQRAATSWKREENQQDLQEVHQMEDHETSSRNFQQVTKNDPLDILEDSTPSETEKETARRAGASNVEALTTQDRLAPTFEKERERERKKLDEGDMPGSTGSLSGSPSG